MNNAKEKAKELIEKFYSKYNNVRKDKKYSKEQIRMALICVDEIIASSPSLPILSDNGSFGSDIEESTNWWKEVREEILSF
jgi:hypothetical protein